MVASSIVRPRARPALTPQEGAAKISQPSLSSSSRAGVHPGAGPDGAPTEPRTSERGPAKQRAKISCSRGKTRHGTADPSEPTTVLTV
eukprot:scaffold5167_cov66-Phaeocystis_antarctica.AAC.5